MPIRKIRGAGDSGVNRDDLSAILPCLIQKWYGMNPRADNVGAPQQNDVHVR